MMRDTIKHLVGEIDDTWYGEDVEQGFVTNEYNPDINNYTFVTREEALAIVLVADQRLHRCGGDEHKLYSENLY